MDPLTKLKMKQQREMQHLMEYEKLMREKEYKNNLRLKMKNEKLHNIQEKQKKNKEMIELKAKMHQSNLERTLATSQLIEKSCYQKNTNKVHRTLEILEKYETKYYPEQLNSIHSKAKSHQSSIEHAKKVRENMENSKLHDLSYSLDLRFKKSMEVRKHNNEGLSERHKQEAMKNESYMRLVEQQQKKLQQEREKKGQRFDEKLEKISKFQEEKERIQKEKQLMRLEQEKQRQQMVNEFQTELMKLKEKQRKLKLEI